MKIDISSVKQSLTSFNYPIFIFLSITYIIGMASRTLRWQKLISYRENLSFWFVFKALAIGYMINNLLPAKVGELARMEYIKRRKGIGRSFLLGTIFIERIIDIILVLLIFAFSIAFSSQGMVIFLHNKWLFILLAFFTILAVFFMLKPSIILRQVAFLPVKLQTYIGKVYLSFSNSIHFTSDRNLLFWVSFHSIFIWIITLFSSFLILKGLYIILPFYGYFFLVAVGVLGLVVPSTSGGIGVFHAVATAALVLLGVTPEKALAYAIIAHAFDFFPNVIIGLAVASFEGFSIRSLSMKQSHSN